MAITHSSTAKQEEEQEERGSCQTLGVLLKPDRIFRRKEYQMSLFILLSNFVAFANLVL